MKLAVPLAVCLTLAISVCAFAAEGPVKVDPAAPVKTESLSVSLSANDMPVAEAMSSLAGQSRQKILLESTVKGKVTVSLKDVSLDSALAAVCKPTNLVWRKVYINPKSELIDKPDRFAATLRLMAGLSFPDLVIAGASNDKISVYCQQKQGVADAQDRMVKDLGMMPVYLVSNDAVVAAKEAEKNTPVSKYTNISKEQMDMFMKMTPEDREQALVAGINMMENVGPEYYSSLMQTLMSANPESVKRLMYRQTEMVFSMPQEQRRAMIRLNLESMSALSPEQQKMLQEDAMAIQKEMQSLKQAGQ